MGSVSEIVWVAVPDGRVRVAEAENDGSVRVAVLVTVPDGRVVVCVNVVVPVDVRDSVWEEVNVTDAVVVSVPVTDAVCVSVKLDVNVGKL